ncbi:hypothetical protein F511_06192 [Dorcoceras hygrometricum]|uniref:Uncharacterized protein n=1 Tax=Dorcoceras hygrometricum TaxID=472368 RepID=A0A2Z7D1C5_9LAMI|nr:hypothetical protein F511_06192 [Dorcoceras hygrometricum]
MQGIKATTESREPKDHNNCSTARYDQRNNQLVATGILSTWELPTHLQYTIQDANNQLHLLLLNHEMSELPTPLIVANKPSRENEITQGRCLRTPHQLQANVRKQYPNEASQQEESNATTLALIGAVYRRQSKKIREVRALFKEKNSAGIGCCRKALFKASKR